MKNVAKLVLALCVTATCLVLPGRAKEGDYTLIVAPARFSVIQMAFDLIAKRPAVLVSYRGEASTAEPLIYAWNGKEWVYVSLQDYREMRFLEDSPKNVVILGDEATVPAAIKDATVWTKNKKSVAALDNASLVNEFGRLFKWEKSELDWFASRYNLHLQDESEPYRRSSWYDQKGPVRKSTFKQVAPPSFEPSAAPSTVAPVAAPKCRRHRLPVRPFRRLVPLRRPRLHRSLRPLRSRSTTRSRLRRRRCPNPSRHPDFHRLG